MTKVEMVQSDRWIFGVMLFFGAIGLLASFALSVERVLQLANPQASLICDFNLIFNCGTVMQTWQARVFGFPNSFIGLVAFPVVITLAVAGLSGVKFPRRFMQAAQIGFTAGLLFAYWLFFQSVFVIGVLCPWCLAVTIATSVLFETLLRYNLRENMFNMPQPAHKKVLGWLKNDYDKFVLAVWLAAMILMVVVIFRDGLF